MKSISMLDSAQSNTVVITTVDVLKSAFLEWADEMIQAQKKANEDVMIDEAIVIHRLRSSHLHGRIPRSRTRTILKNNRQLI